MTILNSSVGALRLSLAKGETLIVRNYSGTETVSGSSVPRENGSSRLGAGAFVYGPQTADSNVTITTTGDLDYSVVAGDPLPNVAAVVSMSGGAPVGLITPDGQPVGGGVIAAGSATTLLGDSLMAQGNTGTFSGSVNGGNLSNSHVLWANDYLNGFGGGLDITSYRAVGGKTSAQVISEQLPGALTDATDIAWLHVGANDLNPAVGNMTVAQSLANFESLIGSLAGAKKLVIVDAVQPVMQAGSTSLKSRAFLLPMLNAGIEGICARYRNVVFIDLYSALLDTTSANRDAVSGYLNATDGIHYQTRGAQAAGYAAARALASRIALTSQWVRGANILPALAGTGGTVTPGSGTITGTPPAGWNVQVASGSASVVITQKNPDMIRLAMTNTGGSASTVFLQVADTAALLAAIGPSAALVKGELIFQASGITNCTRIAALTLKEGLGNFGAGLVDLVNEATPVMPTAAFGGRRSTPPMPVPAGSTASGFIIATNLGATTGACTLDIAAPAFYKLT